MFREKNIFKVFFIILKVLSTLIDAKQDNYVFLVFQSII